PMLLSQDSQDTGKIDTALSQFVEDAFPFVGITLALRCWPLVSSAILPLAVLQMKLNNPARVDGSEFNRIDAGHVDVPGVEHQVNMVWIGQLHQPVDFLTVLQLRPKMRMDTKLQPFVADPFPQFIHRLRHLLEVRVRGPFRAALSRVDLQMITTEALGPAHQFEMLVDDAVCQRTIFK